MTDPRLPPGQVAAAGWPVLHHGTVPAGPDPWCLELRGAVERPLRCTVADLAGQQRRTRVADVHCVTGWSVLGRSWTGTDFAVLESLVRPRPQARFLMAHAAGGWSTNLSLADARRSGVAVVWETDGHPLDPIHGGPLRLLVPHLYFWKSCKWLVALEWMVEDRPGFWEGNTVYTEMDPWRAVRGRPLVEVLQSSRASGRSTRTP